MKLHYLKTFLFSSVLCASVQSYALDPRLSYDKISSENFDIIYDAKSYELAKIYLQEAERSHKILSEVFGMYPEKTVVVLDDSFDIANGSAIGVPRPAINIFVNPPTPLATIDHFSLWPRDVFLHEYAHILNMEPALGVWKPFRAVFGSLFRPNMLLPRWYLEGLAVEMESRYNEFGRLKSTDYDALIRALYLDSKWGKETLSEINESSTPYWPGGQRPYFYGALIWHELIQSKSISIVKNFNDQYARRFPWFISKPMVQELGKNYQNFLFDAYLKYQYAAQKQIQKIGEQEVTKGDLILTKDSVFNHSPEMSPDGEKLLFVSENLNGDSLLYVMKRLGTTWIPIKALNSTDVILPLEGLEKNDVQKASWFPNSQKIVFDSVDTYDHTYKFFDLYTYDLNDEKITQLTKGLRAREPAVSPKGDQIVFIKAGQGKTALYTVDAEGKNPTQVYAPIGYDRVSRPNYLNEQEVIFSQKIKGVDRLHVLNLKTKIISRILDYPGKYPVMTSQGVVFSSNKSGVENLYIASPDFTSIKPLTNSLTRIINGTIDLKANKIIYSELTGYGPQIKEANFSKSIKILPPIAHPIANDFPEKIIEEDPLPDVPAKKYSPLPYMFPQYWMPFVTLAPEGTIASVTIPGSDPTGFHSYLLGATYDSRPEKFSGYFVYQWQNSFGKTVFQAMDYNTWYSSLNLATNSQELNLIHGFYVGPKNDWQAILGYEYKKSSIIENVGLGLESRNHYFNGPSVKLSYENMAKKRAMDISPSGEMASVKQTKYFSNSTHTDFDETLLKLSYFHKEWLPDRHVLALSAQGVTTDSNRDILLGTTTTQGEFTLGPLADGFVTRGYPSGQFIGYSMASGLIEYRFPIAEKWSGPNDTTPFFLKRIHGSVFGETLTLRGIYFDENESVKRANIGKYYTTAGIEVKADTTMLYHVPITVKFVTAYGFETKAGGGFNYYLAFMAPELF